MARAHLDSVCCQVPSVLMPELKAYIITALRWFNARVRFVSQLSPLYLCHTPLLVSTTRFETEGLVRQFSLSLSCCFLFDFLWRRSQACEHPWSGWWLLEFMSSFLHPQLGPVLGSPQARANGGHRPLPAVRATVPGSIFPSTVRERQPRSRWLQAQPQRLIFTLKMFHSEDNFVREDKYKIIF